MAKVQVRLDPATLLAAYLLLQARTEELGRELDGIQDGALRAAFADRAHAWAQRAAEFRAAIHRLFPH